MTSVNGQQTRVIGQRVKEEASMVMNVNVATCGAHIVSLSIIILANR